MDDLKKTLEEVAGQSLSDSDNLKAALPPMDFEREKARQDPGPELAAGTAAHDPKLTFGQRTFNHDPNFEHLHLSDLAFCRKRLSEIADKLNDSRNNPASSGDKKRLLSTAITHLEIAELLIYKASHTS
jgi:hypothetical protein